MPGIELTCRYARHTIHLLGYGFQPYVAQQDAQLQAYLDQVRERDRAWAREMCRKSCQDPIVIHTPDRHEHLVCIGEDELSWVRGTMPSPFHISVVLARKLACISDELDIPARHWMYMLTGRPEPERKGESYWSTLGEHYAPILERYGLVARAHWWTPHPTADLLNVREAVRTLDRIGGLPVLAHPGEQKLSDEQIRHLVGLGVRGIEVYTFKHTPAYIVQLETLAKSLGVFTTSGSDFHDPHHRAQVELGRDRSGKALTQGLSLSDLYALGAYIH
jgi:hypothetical protein